MATIFDMVHSDSIDLASEYLTDAYVTMLNNDFPGLGNMHCALELRAEHASEMTGAQRRALDAFIVFWDALENLERETERGRDNV